jgi:hypothetical protein
MLRVWPENPLANLEVCDPQCRKEPVFNRQNVAERVTKRSLAVTAILSGEQRRLWCSEATSLESYLGH